MFLNDNGLSKLYPTLMNKDIDFETLSLINDQDLRKLGFSLGQCIKIKKAIQGIDTQQSQHTHDDEPVQSLIPLAERDDEVIDVASENQLKKNNTYEEQHNKESPEADPDDEENLKFKKKALIGVSIFFIILILILALIFGLGLFGIINIPFINILMNPTNTTLPTSLMTTSMTPTTNASTIKIPTTLTPTTNATTTKTPTTLTPTTMTSSAMKLSTTTTPTNVTSKSILISFLTKSYVFG